MGTIPFLDTRHALTCAKTKSQKAEAVFKDVVQKKGFYAHFGKIDSAGTAGYHVGDFPDPRTIDICKKHNVPIDHVGQQLKAPHFDEFDWILVMDNVIHGAILSARTWSD
jgi:low molecular weight phosphotyrosine protein phosphatase